VDTSKEEARTAEECKAEGNRLAVGGDWQEAARLYSEGLRKIAGSDIDSQLAVLLPLLSNWSQAYLQLGKWDAALQDANDALQLDAAHTKSQVRQAKALQHLERYLSCPLYKVIQLFKTLYGFAGTGMS
jgi:tetratricopeptide (TPR) repeat protein